MRLLVGKCIFTSRTYLDGGADGGKDLKRLAASTHLLLTPPAFFVGWAQAFRPILFPMTRPTIFWK
jgi:hypothetical protein